MHDGMQYDSRQGQVHEPFNVGNPAVFKSYLVCHLQWELATDREFLNYGTISKFVSGPIFHIWPSFCVT